jgi:hypothetical protein
MKLLVAQRTVMGRDFDKEVGWLPNPWWITAPYELIQLPAIEGAPPVTGPFRFAAKDFEKAKQYAIEQNWDELLKLAIPETIPPPCEQPS